MYPVLSADPRWCVEADDREEGCDLKPPDKQLLICDQVSGERATCWEREREMGRGEEETLGEQLTMLLYSCNALYLKKAKKGG